MDDRTRYDVVVALPHDQRSDTAIASTTAWWTHPELEHYQKTIRGVLRLGYPIVMVGPPKGIDTKDVSLSKGAYDMHRILDEELPQMNEVNPDLAIVLGASRAAMIAMGMTKPSYAQGRTTPYMDITAPCIAQKIEAKDWPGLISQVPGEMASTLGIAYEYGKRLQLFSYLQSLFPKDPTHGLNALRILPGLIGGEAGRLADTLSPETAVHMDQFKKDGWAQVANWVAKFRDRPNVVITKKPGTHVSGIARTNTRRDINARLERLAEIRGYDGSFAEVDFVNDVLPVNRLTSSL